MIQRYFYSPRLLQLVLPCAVYCLVFAIGCGGDSQPTAALVEPAGNTTQTDASADGPVGAPDRESVTDKLSSNDNAATNVAQADPKQETPAADQPSGQSAKTENVNSATVKNATLKKEKTAAEIAQDKAANPHKNQSTLVLASPPDIRARHLLKFVRSQLTDDQEDQALDLLLRNDYHFQRLIKKRENVQNVATDGDETSEKLRLIKVETVEVSNRLRQLVYTEILTPEQKRVRKEIVAKAILAKKLEAEKQKR